MIAPNPALLHWQIWRFQKKLRQPSAAEQHSSVDDVRYCVAAENNLPDPANYSLLLRNIERHQLTNVVPLQMAVSASSGTAKFASEAALGSALSSHLPRATTGKVETVKTISFADACTQWGVPAFVKMDIEGAEIETLSAARSLLMDHAIHFTLDTNHW